jgi:hypothetical protein
MGSRILYGRKYRYVAYLDLETADKVDERIRDTGTNFSKLILSLLNGTSAKSVSRNVRQWPSGASLDLTEPPPLPLTKKRSVGMWFRILFHGYTYSPGSSVPVGDVFDDLSQAYNEDADMSSIPEVASILQEFGVDYDKSVSPKLFVNLAHKETIE